jgi:hypothetical protein
MCMTVTRSRTSSTARCKPDRPRRLRCRHLNIARPLGWARAGGRMQIGVSFRPNFGMTWRMKVRLYAARRRHDHERGTPMSDQGNHGSEDERCRPPKSPWQSSRGLAGNGEWTRSGASRTACGTVVPAAGARAGPALSSLLLPVQEPTRRLVPADDRRAHAHLRTASGPGVGHDGSGGRRARHPGPGRSSPK